MAKIVTLSEAASIALHGIILVARSSKQVNVNYIAEVTDSSRHHVAKVFQRLVKDGFVESQRGPTGGFLLKRKPEDITLLQVYEAIEGKIEVTDCPMEKPICPFGNCIIENVTRKMTEQYREYLNGQVLASYL